MPLHSFILNGEKVSIDIENSIRMRWVLRNGTGVPAAASGCGTGACLGCTSHLTGEDRDPCSVPAGDTSAAERAGSIEGVPKTGNKTVHPVQEAWTRYDLGQCGYCAPGQIMAATALIKRVKSSGRKISEADLDTLRAVCRCGTHDGLRDAIKFAASRM